jgi:hypothetical protein
MTTSTANIANISVGMRVYNANTASANATVTSIRNSTSGITWASYTNWANNPASYFLFNSPIIDNGSNKTFNCLVTTEATGTVSYQIRSSITGNFDGSESLTTVTSGNVNIPAHQGQFVVVTANVASTTQLPTLTSMDVTITDEPIQLTVEKYIPEVQGSWLRNVLGRTTSYIVNLTATAWVAVPEDYTVAGYANPQYTFQIQNTGGHPPQLLMVDKDNGSGNVYLYEAGLRGVIAPTFDLLVYALPEQYVDGNNIKQR